MSAEEQAAPASAPLRTIGLRGATGIGVGAIVGGGILILAGVAFAETGPGAILAFALNGAVALVTALSFAELSTAFPESGGAYVFAKKVLSVRAAFAVGWVLWFAYIVAGVLYALGFAEFAVIGLQSLWLEAGATPPAWLGYRGFGLALALGAAIIYAVSLIRRSGGGGGAINVGKVAVFTVIIVAGVVALVRQPLEVTVEHLSPFLPHGSAGLLAAMGFTFIALQGFDLIAAVAGEVTDPARNIPRAMFLSLGIALVIYLPMLFLMTTVGVEPGASIGPLAAENPGAVVPTAIRRFMGPVGYWLVIVAAVLSTLSALQANVLAASRVAYSMARDRTLPSVLGKVHVRRQTPVMGIYATVLTLAAILFMVPDLASAGAAASLIFLLSFTLAHYTAYLARTRGGGAAGFQTPWFPLVPIGGGLACAGLGVFQAVVVPSAGAVVLIWLGLGVMLYVAVFASGAELADASAEAMDPALVRLRGRTPLILLPIANPAHAVSMVAVANALAPGDFARVLLLTIVGISEDSDDERLQSRLGDVQEIVRQALLSSYRSGHHPEALITAAPVPWKEIERVATARSCAGMLLGLGEMRQGTDETQLEDLMNQVDCDVAVMRAPPSWRLEGARRILVPIGGRGEQHEMRARMLGAICRSAAREVTFVRVMPQSSSDADLAEVRRSVARMAEIKVRGLSQVEILRSDDPTGAVLAAAADHDLIILGLRQVGRRAAFGDFALSIAREAPCAVIMLKGKR